MIRCLFVYSLLCFPFLSKSIYVFFFQDHLNEMDPDFYRMANRYSNQDLNSLLSEQALAQGKSVFLLA